MSHYRCPALRTLQIGEATRRLCRHASPGATFTPIGTVDGIVRFARAMAAAPAPALRRADNPSLWTPSSKKSGLREPPADDSPHGEKCTRRTSSGTAAYARRLLIALGVGLTTTCAPATTWTSTKDGQIHDMSGIPGCSTEHRVSLAPSSGSTTRQGCRRPRHFNQARSKPASRRASTRGRACRRRHSGGATCTGRELWRADDGGRPVCARRPQCHCVAGRAVPAALWPSTPCWVLTAPTTTTIDGAGTHRDARSTAVRPSRSPDLPG